MFCSNEDSFGDYVVERQEYFEEGNRIFRKFFL